MSPAASLKLAVVQFNATVGDLPGNTRRIIEAAREALHEGGFADAEIAVQCEDDLGRERGGEFAGERLSLGGGRRGDAGAEFIVDARSHGSWRG